MRLPIVVTMNIQEPIDPASRLAAGAPAITYDRTGPRSLRWIVAITAGAALGIWLVVASMLHVHSDQFKDDLATTLTDTNSSIAEFLVAWAGDLESTLDFVVGRPDVVYAVERIVEAGSMEQTMQTGFLEMLGPLLGSGQGVAVASPDGRIIASSGAASLVADPALEAAVSGTPGPAFSVLPPDPADPAAAGPIPAGVRVWAPIGGSESPIGWLGIEVDIGPLARMLRSAAATTDSREVYVFDDAGQLVTPSRFETQLVELGLIEPGGTSIGLPVLDPGHNLLKAYGAGPDSDAGHTLMVSSALADGSGVNVEGYRDYRGVTVVGAWTWIDELSVGIATEIDRSEAFAPFGRTSMIWAIGAAVVTVLVVVLSLVFGITDRRLRRTGRDLMDLTEHLDEQVRERTADLEASRLRAESEARARADLVAAVSHELRTPLTSVIGFAQLLKEREDDFDPALRVFVDLLLQEGEDMADLVDDLLTSVRISTESLEIVPDVVDLAHEASSVISAWESAERGRIELATEAALAVGDRRRVRQVVRNLVSNAVRHGGPSIRLLTGETADAAVVTVADDGPPIDPVVAARMFDAYSRGPISEGLAPSLGIGLSLCRQLAAAMGGAVEFDRRDGWNRFSLVLPAHVEARVETAA